MESNHPEISVIVPIYNAEKYLHRCIDSILDQTFKDFEVLLINDGSTDQSPAICDEYAKKDSRVRVFHKENGGVSSARQLGIEKAKGLYSIHVDSDDWIETCMIEYLYKETLHKEDIDIVVCAYYADFSTKTIECQSKPSGKTGENLYADLMTAKLYGSCVNKLVRHSLYSKHKIAFPLNVSYGEDWYVNVLLAKYSRSIGYVKRPLYHYVQNSSSIMHSLNRDSYLKRYDLLDKVRIKLNLDFHDQYFLSYIFLLKLRCFTSALFTKEEIEDQYFKLNAYFSMRLPLNFICKIKVWCIINKKYLLLKYLRMLYQFYSYLRYN